MFVKVSPQSLLDLALTDPARNYFICYTLLGNQPYEASWAIIGNEDDPQSNTPNLAVFLRKSGLIQIAKQPTFDVEHYKLSLYRLLSEISWRQANVAEAFAKIIGDMPFQIQVEKGARIAKCTAIDYRTTQSNGVEIRCLDESYIPAITDLYKTVFESFARPEYMIEKLKSGRGRVIGAFRDGRMVSVAQTDFERADFALIVGVATDPEHQGKGYGRTLMEALCKVLLNEGKMLYLQYDSPVAGSLYESMGFKTVEQIMHIKNLVYYE